MDAAAGAPHGWVYGVPANRVVDRRVAGEAVSCVARRFLPTARH
jgi:hypothetical protein